MDNSLLELLNEITVFDLILVVSLLIIIIGILTTQKSKISKLLNKWRINKNKEEDFHALVYELKDAIENLSKEVKQNQKDRDQELLHYRDDSRAIRDKMYEIMNEQSNSIKELKDTVIKIQEKNSKTKRAELKERIEKIYRECHPSRACTSTQFESLKDLIAEYEEHGGDNSFVHTLVEPEMYEWQIIDKIN